MKKVLFSLVAICMGMCAMAQSSVYVYQKDGKTLEIAVSNLDSISFTKPTTGIENGYTWVDLGLSVKWATCNIGATKPEDYGNYYAWGEIKTKDSYTWENYTLANGSYDALTKYCDNSSYGNNGFTDELTTLETADDAASQIWGGNWRMPTIEELDELVKKCTWTWTTLNGVNGYEIKATNGKSIFLPAAGYRDGDELNGAGSYGSYWSSSLRADYPNYAQYVGFGSDGRGPGNDLRSYGRSVRPVLDK